MSQDQRGEVPATRRRASFGQTARAVFWAFFGVRKRAHYAEDAEKLNPIHLIVMGIISAAAFIGLLLLVVKLVLRAAVH